MVISGDRDIVERQQAEDARLLIDDGEATDLVVTHQDFRDSQGLVWPTAPNHFVADEIS